MCSNKIWTEFFYPLVYNLFFTPKGNVNSHTVLRDWMSPPIALKGSVTVPPRAVWGMLGLKIVIVWATGENIKGRVAPQMLTLSLMAVFQPWPMYFPQTLSDESMGWGRYRHQAMLHLITKSYQSVGECQYSNKDSLAWLSRARAQIVRSCKVPV